MCGDSDPGERRHHPARAHGVVANWFRFAGFDAVDSPVAGQSPGAEHDGEVLAVDHAVTVEVGGAGGRAVVARSAFGPATAEFGAGVFGVDSAATCDTACASRFGYLAGRYEAGGLDVRAA